LQFNTNWRNFGRPSAYIFPHTTIQPGKLFKDVRKTFATDDWHTDELCKGHPIVPDNPIIPFIHQDGTGVNI
jgi:hypothetical protein